MLDCTAHLLCQILVQKHVDSWECLKGDSQITLFTEPLSFLGEVLLLLFPTYALLFGFIHIVGRFFKNISRNSVLLTTFGCFVCSVSLTVLPFLSFYDIVYAKIFAITYFPLLFLLIFLVLIQFECCLQVANVANPSLLTLTMSSIASFTLLLTTLRFFPQKAFSTCNFTALFYVILYLAMSSIAFLSSVYHSIVFFNFWTAEKLDIYEEGKKIGCAIEKEGQWIEYVEKPEHV